MLKLYSGYSGYFLQGKIFMELRSIVLQGYWSLVDTGNSHGLIFLQIPLNYEKQKNYTSTKNTQYTVICLTIALSLTLMELQSLQSEIWHYDVITDIVMYLVCFTL